MHPSLLMLSKSELIWLKMEVAHGCLSHPKKPTKYFEIKTMQLITLNWDLLLIFGSPMEIIIKNYGCNFFELTRTHMWFLIFEFHLYEFLKHFGYSNHLSTCENGIDPYWWIFPNFLMLCLWLTSQEGFNIKWWHGFRACLNSNKN